jgi:hypothetical protein
MLDRAKVREVTGVFPSRAIAISADDDLLLAGFDRADIDVLAEGEHLGKRFGGIAVPAVELADTPDAPRQEFVAPEDAAAIYTLCVAVMGCFGAMTLALSAIAGRGTTALTVFLAVVGAVIGCGLGILSARCLGWRWTPAADTPAATGVSFSGCASAPRIASKRLLTFCSSVVLRQSACTRSRTRSAWKTYP